MPPTINNNITNNLSIIKISYRAYLVKRPHDLTDTCSCLSFLFEFIFS